METLYLLKRLMSHIRDLISDTIKEAVSPLAPYLKMLATGVIFLIIGGSFFYLVFLFAGAGLFLLLAEYHKLAYASFWTAGAYFVLSLILLLIGFARLRKPKEQD